MHFGFREQALQSVDIRIESPDITSMGTDSSWNLAKISKRNRAVFNDYDSDQKITLINVC